MDISDWRQHIIVVHIEFHFLLDCWNQFWCQWMKYVEKKISFHWYDRTRSAQRQAKWSQTMFDPICSWWLNHSYFANCLKIAFAAITTPSLHFRFPQYIWSEIQGLTLKPGQTKSSFFLLANKTGLISPHSVNTCANWLFKRIVVCHTLFIFQMHFQWVRFEVYVSILWRLAFCRSSNLRLPIFLFIHLS